MLSFVEDNGVLIGLLAAVIGWLITWSLNRVEAARQRRLERVDRQIRDLYGPVYVRLRAMRELWDAFLAEHPRRHGEPSYFIDDGASNTDDEKTRWCLWMSTVFLPMNREARDIVLANMDLFDGHEVPAPVLDFIIHVGGYDAIEAQWNSGDHSRYVSFINFPREFEEFIGEQYKNCLARQGKLLTNSEGSIG